MDLQQLKSHSRYEEIDGKHLIAFMEKEIEKLRLGKKAAEDENMSLRNKLSHTHTR